MAATKYQIFVRYLNQTVNRPLTNTVDAEWVSGLDWADMQEFYANNKTEYNSIMNDMMYGSKTINDLTTHEVLVYEKCTRYLKLKKGVQQEDGSVVLENLFIRGYCAGYHEEVEDKANCKEAMNKIAARMTEVLTESVMPSNPKYDMLFMYAGIGTASFAGWRQGKNGKEKEYPTNFFPWEERNNVIAIHLPDDGGAKAYYVPEVYMEHMKRVSLDPWFFHSTHASLQSAMNKAKELVNILGKEGVKIGKVVELEQYIDIA